VTTGSYPVSEFNGGNLASNLKVTLSAACPEPPDDLFMVNGGFATKRKSEDWESGHSTS
jgi:hypothetical protein